MLLEFVLLSLVALSLLYHWATANNGDFKKRGIPYDKPFPLFGSLKDLVLRKKSMFHIVNELYGKSESKVYGVFDQRTPVLLIRDPELVKQITIKDFEHFVNHRPIFSVTNDENLYSSSLGALQDEKWRQMRSTLSPVFTGSKMRQMFELINQVAQTAVDFMKQEAGIDSGLEFDLKEYSTRFTSDVIASTAFGLEVNSFKDENNEFYRMGRKVTSLTKWQSMKFFLYCNFKRVMELLQVQLVDPKDTDYFMHLVLDAMQFRQQRNITRPDMIQLLMEARGMVKSETPKPNRRDFTDLEMVAQCFLFFVAGFETVSLLMCFAAHELMENPEMQEKLCAEIQQVSVEQDGKPLCYDVLQRMKYLDMVIAEVLRKWPAAVAMDRLCNKDIVYELEDGVRIEIKKGDSIWIPVSGFHYDPKYFENPERFDPKE